MQTRKTFQKALTLDAVREIKNHPTADQVYAYVFKKYPEISRATIYRNLNYLCQTGDIYRVKNASGADHFDHNTHPHYHFLCKSCGHITDINVPYMSKINEKCQSVFKGQVTDHQIFFEGLCEHCLSEN